MRKEHTKRKKIAITFLIFLLLSKTIILSTLPAKAQDTSTGQLQLLQPVSEPITLGFLSSGNLINRSNSESISVGFGNNSTVLQSKTSSLISLGVNNPLPSITLSNPISLPPVKGEKKITIAGTGFNEKTVFSTSTPNEPMLISSKILDPIKAELTLNVSENDVSNNKVTIQAINKNIKDLTDFKSNIHTIPLEYSSPILSGQNGKSLLNIAPVIGVAPQVVTFDAKDIINPDDFYLNNPSMLSYSWDFGDSEENNEKNPNFSQNQFATHLYNTPGKYLVTLKVENENNKFSTTTKQIEIRDKNLAPEGSFETDLTSADVPVEINFTSMVTDQENDEISYLWNFGDGETSTELNPKHTYKIPGKYKPILIVKDSLGAITNISTGNLSFLPPNNLPIAKTGAIPQNSTLTINNTGSFTSNVQFLSNGTFDADNEELSYLWEFGDGATSTELNPKHEYSAAGEYNAKLTVTDMRKGKDIKEIKITISKPSPNAIARIEETTGNAPFEVTLNGSSSQDYDGKPVTLKWDFGDGTQQNTDSTSSLIKHTYSEPGVYLVTLSALTNDNRSKIINPGNIIVVPTNAPVAKITKIEGDNQGVIGKAKVKLSASGSYDPTTQAALKYKWLWNARTFDANGNTVDISDEINNEISSNISETFEYTFTKAGQYTPVLETEKADGAKYQFFGETFTVTNNDGPVAIGKATSNLTDLKPGVEISFDGSESYNTKANGSISQFIWDFGDGEKSTEISPKHTFNKEGSFTPVLIVIDNENQIGFAQTATIKIVKSPKEVNTNNTLSSRTLLQTTNQNETEDINLLIQSMIQEAINASTSTDNVKPEIGQITIEPNSVRPGDSVKLSAFIRDNIALSNFGYRLIGPSGNIVTQTARDLINESEDKVLKSELYIEEVITVPQNAIPGIYKINLTATDTNKNQIAKAGKSNANEEISVNLEVKNNDLDKDIIASNINKLLVPSEVTEVTNEVKGRVLSIDEKEAEETIDFSSEKFAGFYLRGKNITPTNLVRQRKLSQEKETEIRYLTNGFEVTGVTAFVNPWISISPSTMNSLELHAVTERSGYIEIATKGSLSSTYFGNWANTNVYVDSKKVGTISWLNGAAISFDSDTASTSRYIQFRPVNRSGNEMPSETWTGNNIILNKDLTPQVTNYLPKEFLAGRGSFDLVVYGSNFSQSSKVYFGTSLLTPYAASPTQLVVRIPANLVRYAGTQYLFVVNANNVTSVLNYFNVKENPNTNVCSLSKTLPQTYWGADSRTILDGDNVYLTSPTATIRRTGSVTIPFCLDKDYDVKTSAKLTHHKILSGSGNSILFWLDNVFIGGNISYGSESLTFDNLNNSQLSSSQPHELKIQFSGGPNDELLVESATFAVNSGPVLDRISPDSTGLEGQNRILSIYGRYFDQNTIVQIDNEQINRTIVNSGLITLTLSEKFSSPGLKKISVFSAGKQPSETYLTVREKIEVLSGSFKISPTQPFPGSSFDIELQASDKSQDSSSVYTADIGIFDPSGNLLTIPNTSSYYTIKLNGIKNTDKTVSFKGSIPLSINSKAGVYKAVASVQKGSTPNIDYSDLEAFKYISAKALGLDTNDTLIPISHKLTFTPKPAINIVFGIEENNSDNVGFIRVANKLIQNNQSIKFKSLISSGLEHSQNIKYNFKSGDGRESGLISNDNFTFTYTNTNTSSTTPLIYTPQLDIFWAENGTQTKITTFSGIIVLVYPNYRPIATARLLKESYPFYASNPPLKTAFIDNDSYDPNQRFSMAVDYVDSLKNDWKLFELKAGPNESLISLPVDAQISQDKKTFITGNLYTPGIYFAKLTVSDQTGLSDTASTESVTLTKPSQKSIVFATTNPSDKKVFDPKTDATNEGIPVQFSSDVKILGGGNYTKSYKWDFGDGSCHSRESGNPDIDPLPDDCTSPNPTHFYFDGKRSFGGKTFTDRRSVTPKLSVTTKFANGNTETWEASAGTITFNAEPNFVLLDIKPDKTQGIIPFTVSLMVDSSTAKAVNATVERYEINWGEGSQNESGNITFEELINKIFTHAYTNPGTYTPKLTIFIKDFSKTFVFNLPAITAIGTGQAGVFLLDDLNSLSFTNQPLVTFMVFAAFPNPNDENNSLRIKVKDENGLETITELDPSSSNQTLSLSEGKNTYYFESSNSSTETWMSETREIVVDTEKPSLELTSPNESDLILDNLTISGIVSDQLFDSISYKVNSEDSETKISSDDLEDLGENKKAFNLSLNSTALNTQIYKVEITAKDKAGNLTKEEVEITNDKTIKLLSKEVINGATIIKNGTQNIQIKQGEPFQLSTTANICDDTTRKGTDYQAKLKIGSNSFTINGTQNQTTYQNSASGIKDIVPGSLNGCATLDDIFLSGVFNSNDEINEFFLPQSVLGNPTLYWPVGKYTIDQTLTALPESLSTYGSDFDGHGLLTFMAQFEFEVIRNINAEITAFKPENLILNQVNNATFNLTSTDSLPIKDNAHLPNIEQAYIQTPSGKKENVAITCTLPENLSYPLRELTKNCSFSYTPKEYSTDTASYSLFIPVTFQADTEGSIKPQVQASYSDIKVNFEVGANITSPTEYTVIESAKTTVKSQLDRNSLPTEVQSKPDNEIKKLAKYGIKLGSQGKIKPITSKTNFDSIVKGKINSNLIKFENDLNFNLSTDTNFKDSFDKLTAFGPLYLYTAISSSSLENTTFSYSKPQKLVLLDKSKVEGKLKTNTKTNNKALSLTITTNAGFGGKYPLYLAIEPHDTSGNVLGTQGQYDIKEVKIPLSKGSKSFIINALPAETNEVKVTLFRNDDFLKSIQGRLDKENFAFNILSDNKHKTTFSGIIKLSDSQLTSCSVSPSSATANEKVDLNYKVKSVKSVSISASGKNSDGSIQKSIELPTELKNKTDWAKSGIVSFAIPESWKNYSAVIITLTSADESDSCELKIGNDGAFQIGDGDGKTTSFNRKTISVRELKELLYTIGLLSNADYTSDKYTDGTNQAYWKFICAVQEAKDSTLDPSLRLQTAENPLKCTLSQYEGYPDIKYIEDVSQWKEFIDGLKTKVGQDISAYVNPMTIGTIAAFIAWNAVLPVNAWILLIVSFVGTTADVTIRVSDVKDLWNNNSNINYSKTSNWKIGYSIGTLLTAIPGILPANIAKNVKVAEVAGKLDDFSNLQDLITSEQRTINALSGLEPTGVRQEILNNFVTFLKDIPNKVQNYELSGLSLLDKTIGELRPLGEKSKLLELFAKDTAEVGNTTILKNILTDEVQAEAVAKEGKQLAKDLADAAISAVNSVDYMPISVYFNNKGYEKISKVIPRDSVPQYQSKCVTPEALQKYNLPDSINGIDIKNLSSEEIVQRVVNGDITKEHLIGNISSGSMTNFVTPTEPIQSLTATQINGPKGLGLGISSSDFKGLVEIQIDTSKLPSNVEFRLPISVLGNQYFKPIKLNSNSGVTIGNYLEWIADEFSALTQGGIIVKIKGLPKNE